MKTYLDLFEAIVGNYIPCYLFLLSSGFVTYNTIAKSCGVKEAVVWFSSQDEFTGFANADG